MMIEHPSPCLCLANFISRFTWRVTASVKPSLIPLGPLHPSLQCLKMLATWHWRLPCICGSQGLGRCLDHLFVTSTWWSVNQCAIITAQPFWQHSDISGNLILNNNANEIMWSCHHFSLWIAGSSESKKVPSIIQVITVNTWETGKDLSQIFCIYW